jgi:hypothetical protein
MTAFPRKDMLGLIHNINQEDQMRSLLGDRFLKWFAGDLKNRWKQPVSIFNDQIHDSDVYMTIGPDNLTSEEDCTILLSKCNNLQNEEKQNKKNEPVIQNE